MSTPQDGSNLKFLVLHLQADTVIHQYWLDPESLSSEEKARRVYSEIFTLLTLSL